MRNVNRLVILTIVFNFFILIGAGHGIGFLGLIEFLGPNEFVQGDVKFSLTGKYDDRLFTAATIAAVGQIILLVGYFRKTQHQKFRLIFVGLFILLFSYFSVQQPKAQDPSSSPPSLLLPSQSPPRV